MPSAVADGAKQREAATPAGPPDALLSFPKAEEVRGVHVVEESIQSFFDSLIRGFPQQFLRGVLFCLDEFGGDLMTIFGQIESASADTLLFPLSLLAGESEEICVGVFQFVGLYGACSL